MWNLTKVCSGLHRQYNFFSNYLKEHAHNVDKALDILNSANLVVNLSKFSCCKEEFLGLVIFKEVLSPNPTKVDAILVI